MEINNNIYTVNGVDLLQLVSKYEAPLYVYDTAKIESQYHRLLGAFKNANVKLNYACKALSNINIIKFIGKLGAGLDTVSVQEVELALLAEITPEDIMYTPNGVSMEEIHKVVAKGVHINIDNLNVLDEFGRQYKNSKPISVRINPHIMAGGNLKISTGHKDSKFGISVEQIEDIKAIVDKHKLNVVGLHMHTGSDILDIEAFIKGANVLFNIAKQFDNLDFIDLGSGFKVPYKEGDVVTDIELLGQKLSEKFNAFCKSYGKQLTLKFEPGKFLVSEAGYFLTKVNTIKKTPSTVFAGLDTGQNHLIRPMFYGAHHDIVNISNSKGNTKEYSVVGYICETDTFAWNREISEIKAGDILCFKNAGAYCFMMSSNYNSRFRPAEVMIHNGKDYLIRKRETLEDLLRNQVQNVEF